MLAWTVGTIYTSALLHPFIFLQTLITFLIYCHLLPILLVLRCLVVLLYNHLVGFQYALKSYL